MICYKCFSYNTMKELRPSNKVKGLSHESSKKLKMCKNCKGRVFYSPANQT